MNIDTEFNVGDSVCYLSGDNICHTTVSKITIEISYMYGNYWIYDILTIPNHDLVGLSDRPIVRYNTYEEALEAGLQETLKLI